MTTKKALEKAAVLVDKMTAEEAASQLQYNSPAIERLGINEYNWWNEALHGVARAGTATVFPQSIGLAATFDGDLIYNVADTISTEARAKYNQSIRFGDRDIFKGLTYWSPNINIFRDPRWGRGQETFGEDPFLTATMGCQFIKGLQGNGEFLKAAACAKHYAVHSGPEALRHTFNAESTEQDLNETYLPAFEWAVKSADVKGVMGAYNRTNGEPCCASKKLIKEILLDKWGFDGYFVSDCGAIADIDANHHYTDSPTEAVALALKAGCNLNCGSAYFENLINAYEEDKIDEKDLKDAATKLFAIRYLLGEFEEVKPYSDISFDKLDSPENKALNLKAAQKSLVLLKNENDFLPLSTKDTKSIAVIGPNSDSKVALDGNYAGQASEYVTIVDGIRRVFPQSSIRFAKGSNLWFEQSNCWDGFGNMLSTGAAAAANSDVAILCLGLDSTIEGEGEGANGYSDSNDKPGLYLPKTQQKLAETVCDNCENVIVVVMAGSQIDLGEKVRNHAKAIIYAWYPGALGGLAVAQLIAGEYSPSGKLPLTFYYGDQKLPEFTDYSMDGRTYRFFDGEALYPFGYGLSYTKFTYSNAVCKNDGEKIKVLVNVKNEGKCSGQEAVQVYAKYTDSTCRTPNYQLCGIKSVEIESGKEVTAEIEIDPYWLKAVNEKGERINPDGGIELFIGGHQPDKKSNALCGYECIKIKL